MAEGHLSKNKVQLLRQAISAASSSLKLANQLLNEIERIGGAEVPGLVGKYDGRFMVTQAGKKYPVPDNYSAKTRLVYGDKLKMTEGPLGRQFKLVEKLSRVEADAQLAIKDGQFEALGKGGSYRLLQSAVKYWGGEEGDKVKILLPEGGKNIPFACLLEIVGKKPGVQKEVEEKKEELEVKKEPVKEEKKAPVEKTVGVQKEVEEKKEELEVKKEPVKEEKKAPVEKTVVKKETKAKQEKATAAKKITAKKTTKTAAKEEKPAVKKSELISEEELR